MKDLGKIIKIEEVYDIKLGNIGKLNGSNGARLGTIQIISALGGYGSYDGYELETDKNKFYILIENEQNCCEDWGYLSTNDNIKDYIGKTIKKVVLTDTNLSNKEFDELEYLDCGGVQFVTFYLTDGDILQLAVYNAHNGYYGHNIIIAQNEDILLEETL